MKNNKEYSLISYATLCYRAGLRSELLILISKDRTKTFNDIIKSMAKGKPNKNAKEFIKYSKSCDIIYEHIRNV